MIALCHRVALCELGVVPTDPATYAHARNALGYDYTWGWLRQARARAHGHAHSPCPCLRSHPHSHLTRACLSSVAVRARAFFFGSRRARWRSSIWRRTRACIG